MSGEPINKQQTTILTDGTLSPSEASEYSLHHADFFYFYERTYVPARLSCSRASRSSFYCVICFPLYLAR